ncbi:MAG: tetraacyldisaccharide 4'-kinase [Chitinophagaceae bacterium]
MNFNFPLLGPIRIILFPFSFIYFAVIWCRNRLYDKNILTSSSFNLPVICVGNLSTGGTGKSPMVLYLVKSLKDEIKVATLSRGYKRKTKGYAMADEKSTALEIGDEPMLFHIKFPDVAITVGEERVEAIPQLLHDRPDTGVIILDDAFQHRAVKAGYNILLVDCNNLFTRDWYLPTGDLRDEKKSYKRADLVIITKCAPDMQYEEKELIAKEIDALPHQHLFFSTIRYGTPYHIFTHEPFKLSDRVEVLLVTGIADPGPLKKYLQDKTATYHQLNFSDHQIFTIDDLKDITTKFENIEATTKIILTTEKDAVRLTKFSNSLAGLPLYVIPIEHEFLFNEELQFNEFVKAFIHNFNYS